MVFNWTLRRTFGGAVAAASVAMLAACGGGGGGSSTSATTTTPITTASSWPSSGAYAAVLKVTGSSTASPLNVALSLVHPATPTVEYVMDVNTTPTNLGESLVQGTYNPTTKQVTGLNMVAFVDAPAGVLRTTAMVANGSRPLQLTGPTAALCSKSISAANFATPYATQIAVDTPGADGVCGTADDGQTLLTFGANGAPLATTMNGSRLLGYMRSATTGQPSHWVSAFPSGSINLTTIANAPVATVLAFSSSATYVYTPVDNWNDTVLFTQNGALKSVSTSTGGAGVYSLSAATGPDGWQPGGSNASSVQAYLNTNTAGSGLGSWQILSISRANQSVTTLATGTGSLSAVSTSNTAVYASVISGSNATLYKISTATGTRTVFFGPSTTTVAGVSGGASGTNLLFTATSAGAVSAQVFDDAGVTLYTVPNGFIYGMDQIQLDTQTNALVPNSYIFTSSFGALGVSGANFIRYDMAAKTALTIGTVPTGASLGGTAAESVFIAPLTPVQSFGGVSATRLTNSVLQSTGAAVYTYNTTVANSLTKTTVQVR